MVGGHLLRWHQWSDPYAALYRPLCYAYADSMFMFADAHRDPNSYGASGNTESKIYSFPKTTPYTAPASVAVFRANAGRLRSIAPT